MLRQGWLRLWELIRLNRQERLIKGILHPSLGAGSEGRNG
jgi:hypothetical protein